MVFLVAFHELCNTLTSQTSDFSIYAQIALYIFLYDPLDIQTSNDNTRREME